MLCNAGGVAQLGEHLLCKQGVVGSIPITSTTGERAARTAGFSGCGRAGSGYANAAKTRNCLRGADWSPEHVAD